MTLTQRIKAHALAEGFTSVGIVPAGPSRTHGFYREWLAAGHGGEMAYLTRHEPLKADVHNVQPGALSVVAVTLNYWPGAAPQPQATPLSGRVACYAWGRDYHQVLREKLERLAHIIERDVEQELGRPLAWRAAVDSAPLMERELSARAGLGWVGKNANLIHWQHGSWLFLGELLLDVALEYDAPRPPREGQTLPEAPVPALLESCGSCTACLDACPTGAIVGDKQVDARRCISYLTIELKGPIPVALRRHLGDWVFGCDVCQQVCPWNRDAPACTEPGLAAEPDQPRPSLVALLALDERGFRQRFRHTALHRAKRRGLLRNAAIALGNVLARPGRVDSLHSAIDGAEAAPRNPAPTPLERREGLAALAGALADSEPVLRGAAAWALGRIGGREAQAALAGALPVETDPTVRAELQAALGHAQPAASVQAATA